MYHFNIAISENEYKVRCVPNPGEDESSNKGI